MWHTIMLAFSLGISWSPIAQLPIQLCPNGLGKAAAWTPATYVEDMDESPGFGLGQAVTTVIWEVMGTPK